MIVNTPPLSVKTVSVFAALFQAQEPDTLSAIRAALKEWTAVHVALESAGALRRALSKTQIRDELLNKLAPDATLLDPVYRLSSPAIPENVIATFVPDAMKPRIAPDYEGWTYVPYREGRARVRKAFEHAIEKEPEGQVGVAQALFGQIHGASPIDEWSGAVSAPTFRRTLEATVDPECTVTFWDTAFAYETKGAKFVADADRILFMHDCKQDRLYFDSSMYTWFAVFQPGNRMRVSLLA